MDRRVFFVSTFTEDEGLKTIIKLTLRDLYRQSKSGTERTLRQTKPRSMAGLNCIMLG